MALNLADYLSANPALLAQIQATYGNGGPTLNTMPVNGPGNGGPVTGLMPIAPPTGPRPTPVPTAPMPMPGNPPPLGNVYHPGSNAGYTPDGKNMYNSPFVRDYVSPLLPQGEYQRTLYKQGLGDADSRMGQYGLSQYANAQRGYQAAQLRNPALSFRDFLAKGGAGDMMSQWRGLSAASRGLNPASRTSVVRWG